MTVSQAASVGRNQGQSGRESGRRTRLWLAVGAAAFVVAFGLYAGYLSTHPMPDWMAPVDIKVYRAGGQIALHLKPYYNGHLGAPLYDWPGLYHQFKFTYPPFAALVFSAFSLVPLAALLKLSLVVNLAIMIAAIWLTLGGLGHRARAERLGGTLLLSAVLLYSEPVQRVLWLGQIELALMALIMWDLCQPDERRWKGVGVGVAAGIKLVPLIFIPYLLLTRRYRQAAVATGTFAATVALGFGVMPANSAKWWFGGLFLQGSRTGFVGWEGNQSLLGMITRLAGSEAAGQPIWLVAAVLTLVVGLACAVVLERAGHPVAGVLTCALAATLTSPISWDHHWVWVVPGVTALASYAFRAREAIRWSLLAVGVVTAGLFAAWPGSLWGKPHDLGSFSLGIIWAPPNTNTNTYYKLGDQPWYPEYHWHGLQLITGNLYVLTGVMLLGFVAGLAVRAALRARRHGRRRPAAPPAAA